MLRVLSRDKSGWWKGDLRGRVGLFPKNFVKEQESSSEAATTAPPSNTNTAASTTAPTTTTTTTANNTAATTTPVAADTSSDTTRASTAAAAPQRPQGQPPDKKPPRPTADGPANPHTAIALFDYKVGFLSILCSLVVNRTYNHLGCKSFTIVI